MASLPSYRLMTYEHINFLCQQGGQVFAGLQLLGLPYLPGEESAGWRDKGFYVDTISLDEIKSLRRG